MAGQGHRQPGAQHVPGAPRPALTPGWRRVLWRWAAGAKDTADSTGAWCYGSEMSATLVRPRRGKIFAGVCAALADRFEVPRAFVRLGSMFFGLFGVGEFVYVALWILIPRDD